MGMTAVPAAGRKENKENMKNRDKLIGAGVGIAAIAAAGAYFLHGRRGAKNREMIAGWALQMKGEVLEKMEHLKEIDRDTYHGLVDMIAQRYGRVKRVNASELQHMTEELKGAWTHISRQLI
jgi:gas vesicle protein